MIYWQPTALKSGEEYHWKIGPLHIWMKRTPDEWLLAYEQKAKDNIGSEIIVARHRKKPESLPWNRFIFTSQSNIIHLIPVMQDRAIVVSPENPVKILPRNRTLFFIDIPVWIRIYVGESREAILTELQTVILSNTWFGDPMSGELCYSLNTKAHRSINGISISTLKAICPVWVMNGSLGHLDFQKLCIRAEHLRVYEGKNRLWTNEVYIKFFGEDQLNEVDFSNKEPPFEEGCRLLSEERKPVDRSILKKSISILKYFTRFEY
ncbi:MAG: hypothetical protein ACUVWJ_02965 [Spirochaetota bacterium]